MGEHTVAWCNLSQSTIVVVAFGRIDRRGFGISNWKMFDRQNNGLKNMVEVDKDQVLGGNFLRERNQSQIKDYLVQRK